MVNKVREIERLRHAKPMDFRKLFTKRKTPVLVLYLKTFVISFFIASRFDLMQKNRKVKNFVIFMSLNRPTVILKSLISHLLLTKLS